MTVIRYYIGVEKSTSMTTILPLINIVEIAN